MQVMRIDTAAISDVAAGTPGWTLWPLVICAALAAAIVIRKLWELSVLGGRTMRLLERLDSLVGQRMIAEALAAARESETPGGRILAAGLSRRAGGSERVARSIANASAIEAAALGSWMIPLATLATLTPLVGFLGSTLLAIRVLEGDAAGAPGFARALVPAAAGLGLAIPITLLHAYVAARVAGLLDRIAVSARHAVDAVQAIESESPG